MKMTMNSSNKRSSSSSSAAAAAAASRSQHFPAQQRPMLPSGTFSGRVALVTGGGTGLGRGVAQALCQLGASVAICSRKLPALEEAAKAIGSATGGRVLPVAADVRDRDSIESVLDQCERELGQSPSLIVNNAAGNFISPSERLSANAFKTIVDIVLLGTANVTTATAKRLIASGSRGSYLSVTTPYADTGSGFVMPSACAKSGVEAMTKSLSAEWARYGLRFNCIAPGPIKTKGAFSRLDPSGQFEAKVKQRIPAGRLGEVGEFANLATYLLSDYASWITGTVVRIDGGELNAMAGEFNDLLSITGEQWDAIEQMVRSVKGS